MSKMKTPIIRYNLKERMRQFNGVERHFNIPKLVASINSSQVQERVKLGDLHGFYGHWPRIKFGAEPQEGGVLDGKVVNLEPCFRTIYLKAFDDGTVEHQAEFFDNEPGKKGFALLENKAGGFSSVISLKGGEYFHGFDLVREPNYSTNRPYALDNAVVGQESDVLVLDDLNFNEQTLANEDYIHFLLDSLSQLNEDKSRLLQENQQLSASLNRLQDEHDLVLDDLVLLKNQSAQSVKSVEFNDSVLNDALNEANKFKTENLVRLDLPKTKAEDVMQQTSSLMDRYWS